MNQTTETAETAIVTGGQASGSALTGVEAERVHKARKSSKAPATWAAYRAAWKAWGEWAEARGVDAMPAAPEAVAAYLSARAETASMATVRLALAGIVAAHKAAGEPSPATEAVRETMRGLATSAPKGRGQARALTRDEFAAIVAHALRGDPRKIGRHHETAETAKRRGKEDAAIAGCLFHAGLRRSEAAALEWRDVEPAAAIPGALTIRVRVSKTNRDGAKTDIRLVKNGAAEALAAIRPEDVEPTAKVFGGLNARTIGRRFTAAAKAAGVEGVTAHSGRVGMASELTAAGASMTETMLAGGWKSPAMVAHYSAGAVAERGAVAKYL